MSIANNTPNDTLEVLTEAMQTKDRLSLELHIKNIEPKSLDPFKLTEKAVLCKERGFPDLAERLLTKVIETYPDFGAAHYEFAVLCRLSDRPHMAIAALLRLLKQAPEEFRCKYLLIHMLHTVGAHPEADEQHRATTANNPAEEAQLSIMREFGLFLAEFPRGRARLKLEEVRRAYRYLDAAAVAAEVTQAIEERRSFSLVRLGDGEGAFAKIGQADELKYANLYGGIRNEWCSLLFGDDFDPMATGYASLVDTLMTTCCQADIVGVPYPQWMDHEYSISSLRGVPCLLNVHRYLLARQAAQQPMLCDQTIHVNLHRQGLLEPILRRCRDIGLISCLPGLVPMIKDRFGIDEVEMFKIPGERYSQALLSQDALAGIHFPFAFWDIVRRLSVPQNGRVFLIAAGTLAKFYAKVIKLHGGIALDIGSLVDGWMKIESRPGYDASLAL